MSKILVVGDSTVSAFNDVTYYYPRFGYGVLLNSYFKNINIVNLALSGRSSKSFIKEKNYKTYLESLESGDFVIIGFGHNDEKSDDFVRFTDASLPITDEKSFKYSLYNNFIKPAMEKGATPILCTPIPRLDLSMTYSGNSVHVTTNGDYRKCILDLASELGLVGVDLTTPVKELSLEMGENQFLLHAISKGKKIDGNITYDVRSVDKAHLSYLGAKWTAYYLASAISKTNSPINKYVKSILVKPELSDLNINPTYEFKDYFTPDLDSYNPIESFKCNKPFYGTAFGTLETTEDLYLAKNEGNDFIVGNTKKCGKFNASNDGFAYAFTRIEKNLNFKMAAKAKVISQIGVKQAGFGLMLRGDSYINQTVANENYSTNYIASGLLTTDATTYVNFSRSNPTDLKKELNTINDFYKNDEELLFEIERLGQVVTVHTTFRGVTYDTVYTDFDYLSMDQTYIYVGMFSTAGTLVRFSDVKLEITGQAKEA